VSAPVDITSGFRECEKRIRILIADDHLLIRKGLNCMLSIEPDLEIVGEARDGVEAVELAAKLQPDIILMDINMPRMDGIAATRLIHQAFPEAKILGLSMHLKNDMSEAMLAAGAEAYISKADSREILLKEIRIKRSASLPKC
jgi:DNA-binding NarL/FixJ family response regulator